MLPARKESVPALLATAKELEGQAQRDLEGESRAPTLRRSLDLRYVGQSYELNVPWEGGGTEGAASAFHGAHERRFTYSAPESPVEIVSVRLAAVVPSAKPPERPRAAREHEPRVESTLRAGFDDREVATRLYLREALDAGAHFEGPAIVSQTDCTTVVAPGWRAEVDAQLGLVLRKS